MDPLGLKPLDLGLVKMLMDYVRENCNTVSELSGNFKWNVPWQPWKSLILTQIRRFWSPGLGSNTYLYLYLNTQISVFVFVFENPQDEIFVFVFVFDWRIWVYLTNIFSCDQAALQMVFSVRLSVCLSVRPSVTPFWLCSHQRIIMKFSGVITNDQSKVHAKGQGQRSKFKVTEVTTQLNRFRTVTPVWIHVWWWNDAYGLMLLRRGALLFFKVIRQISRSHGSKNRRIWPRLGVSGL